MVKLPTPGVTSAAFRPSPSLTCLTGLSAHSQMSRFLLPYLVAFPPAPSNLNYAVPLSPSEYGVLAGVAFTSLFVVGSLASSSNAPKNRRPYAVASGLVTSALVALYPLCGDFRSLAALRSLQGLASSPLNTVGYTYVRDNEGNDQRATSFFSSSVYVGGGLASLAGGLSRVQGWEGVCYEVAAAGLLLSAAAYFGVEDRGAEEEEEGEETDVASTAIELVSEEPTRTLYLASLFRFSAGLTIGAWCAPYFKSAFPEDIGAFSAVNAGIVSLAGLASAAAGGEAVERMGQRADVDARMVVAAASSVMAAVAWAATVKAGGFEAAVSLLALEYLVGEAWFGPAVGYLQASARDGGVAQGLFSVTAGLANVAPGLLGAVVGSELLPGGGELGLADGLAWAVGGCYVASAALFWRAGTLPKGRKDAENLKKS